MGSEIRNGFPGIRTTCAVICILASAGCGVRPDVVHRSPDAGGVGAVGGDLRLRVMEPDPEVIDAYLQSGADEARGHELTAAEWALVERAIADLPPSLQRVLEQRLARLSFIEAPGSAGTALTRSFTGPDGREMFEITVRADVLDASLTEFLTRKEQSLFVDDGSGYTVHVLAGDMPALTYLLMHEATHVLDRAYGVTSDVRPFAAIWPDYRTLAEPMASGILGATPYRRAPPLPSARMPELYRALAASPFVSLYSTASAGEDFAELTAWSELANRFAVPLAVEVRDRLGKPVYTLRPLETPAVQVRMAMVGPLIAGAPTCGSEGRAGL